MNTTSPTLCLLVLFTILSPSYSAENPAPSVTTTPPTTAPALVEPNPALEKSLSDVVSAYNSGDYNGALAGLNEADKLSPNNPNLLNMRGTTLIKMAKWAEATAQFQAALKINPKHFPSRFGMGEVPFMQKKYSEARSIYEPLYAEDNKNELLRYKIFLTYLLEGNTEQSELWLKKFDFMGNTPAYYFAQAAWYFNQKNETEANGYIASSVQIFAPDINNLFAETLIDLGWLKRSTAP